MPSVDLTVPTCSAFFTNSTRLPSMVTGETILEKKADVSVGFEEKTCNFFFLDSK